MSFPSLYPGVCRGCGEAIRKGDLIGWKKGLGAWHQECDPQEPQVDFSGIAAFLKAKHEAFLAAGGVPFKPLEEGESAMVAWSQGVNASAGIYWAKGRGFYGKGFT